jgi:hypothetical protein
VAVEVLVEVAGIRAMDEEMVWIGVATTPSIRDQITTTLRKENIATGPSAMGLAEEGGTFLGVSMVVAHIRAAVEVHIKVLTQGRHISRKVRQPLRTVTREAMDLEVGTEVIPIRETIPAETIHIAIVIGTVMVTIHRMGMPGIALEVIHTAGMAGMEIVLARRDMVDSAGMDRGTTANRPIRLEERLMPAHGVEAGSGNNWSFFYSVGRAS